MITENEEKTMQETKGFKLLNDFGVRAWIATLVIMGYMGSVAYTIFLGNKDMIPTLTTLYMPLVSIVIMFYFQASAMKDMKT